MVKSGADIRKVRADGVVEFPVGAGVKMPCQVGRYFQEMESGDWGARRGRWSWLETELGGMEKILGRKRGRGNLETKANRRGRRGNSIQGIAGGWRLPGEYQTTTA